jgi:hypothetical protein
MITLYCVVYFVLFGLYNFFWHPKVTLYNHNYLICMQQP